MGSTFIKGAATGAATAMLVLAATTAVAGTGIGGVFHLGKSNSVNKGTKLKGRAAGSQLDVTNGGRGAGVIGRLSLKSPKKGYAGVQGINASRNGLGTGVLGTHAGSGVGVLGSTPQGTGVVGAHTATTGSASGVQGTTKSAAGVGVNGSGPGVGVSGNGGTTGVSGSGGATGVSGTGTSAGVSGTSAATGVTGSGTGPAGVGVSGTGPALGINGSSAGIGVNGTATAAAGTGVKGTGGASGVGVAGTGAKGLTGSGSSVGVEAAVTSAGAVGITSSAGVAANDGIQATTANVVGDGVQALTTGSAAFGLFAITSGGGAGVVSSTGPGTSVFAGNNSATNPSASITNTANGGTAGRFVGTNAVVVRPATNIGSTGLVADMTGDIDGDGSGANDGANAIFASSDDTNNSAVITANTLPAPTCDALTCEAIETSGFVDINGNARVTGTLTKGAGSFEIDHPLDPAHYYLRHSFVESPDMKNVYDGTITTNGSGKATVELPDYFGALNKDFRYQLTIVGATFAQAIVSREIPAGGQTFEIRTSKPNVKVSWQVTGTRKDAYANAHRIKVVERKSGEAAGMYLHPELFGHAGERALGLDVRAFSAAKEAASRKAQADLLRLVRAKTAEAIRGR